MAAYRTAARLFPGLHQPYLGMGMEYQRMNNLHLAEHMFKQAHKICPSDPLVAHELGVLAYKNGQHSAAACWLRGALDLVPEQQLTAGAGALAAAALRCGPGCGGAALLPGLWRRCAAAALLPRLRRCCAAARSGACSAPPPTRRPVAARSLGADAVRAGARAAQAAAV
jgi:tetratricopeptide (TPR) repeat protein